jgi:hypothetical protein
MTLWDLLTTKNKPERKTYKFASADFVQTFIKTARDLECPEAEINEQLDFLEKAHQNN